MTDILSFLPLPARRSKPPAHLVASVTTLTEAAAETVVGGINPQPLPPHVERDE
jgi:hypothetical protein